ncbi:hypothetical protein I603_0257 [Erythrobacter dokdonensis DSW-74]|uniref:Uncharacterized protein n=2 Tax=Erythrobacter TaxID=1041 RepID=A0A1A7BK76_9SPHN|nr:hypothetical protein I603_0257 [Erythrobacter dokdonensis DSW-74]
MRLASCLLMLAPLCGAAAEPGTAGSDLPIQQHLASLAEADTPLASLRANLPECQNGCITPGEAAAMAFAAGEGEARPGRFLLDVRGGGQSLHGELGTLFFVNSRQDYATLGTLTVAFEPAALRALLQRAKVCGAADVVEGQISVKGCRREGLSDLNMFTMMQRLGGRRIVVDGEVRLQWIDSAIGAPRPLPNKRGEHERGYYQVWVQVSDADQVIFVYED